MNEALEAQTVTVALVGQPNVGKSAIFSALTGLSQHVANWPGKTSEPRAGLYRAAGLDVRVVDLPGAYSLTASSTEERITRDYILAERPPVIALIADASALERNLYLLTELLALPAPVVLGLNMLDVAEQQGIEVDADVLEAALGLPVVPMIASKGQGLAELMDAAVRLARGAPYAPRRPEIRADHREVLAEIERLIAGGVPPPYPETGPRSRCCRGTPRSRPRCADRLGERWEAVHAILREHEDAVLAVASGRYQWIGRMVRAAVRRPHPGEITLTDRLDRVLTHPVAGLGVLLAVLGLTFWLTYALGTPVQAWLEAHVVHALARVAAGGIERGAGVARGPADRRRDRGGRHGADLHADPADLLRAARLPGRCRLHRARGVRDGPLHAQHGAARQQLHAAFHGLRLQRAGGDGHARHRLQAGAAPDHPAGAAHPVPGAADGHRVPGAHLLRRVGAHWSRWGWRC